MDALQILCLAVAVAFALGMGASGVSVAFAPVHAAGIVPKLWIPGLFGVCVLLGGVFSGQRVVQTLSSGLLSAAPLDARWSLLILAVCAVGLFVAAFLKVPQSTSQTTVAAIVGVGLYRGTLQPGPLWRVLACWLLFPVAAFLLTFLIGRFLYLPIRRDALREEFLERVREHPGLKWVTLVSCCYVAYAVGSNNVANAVGPLVASHLLTPLLLTLIVAPYFGIGASLLGPPILETVGERITTLGPIGAAYVAWVSGTFLLVASYLGIPQSIVQLNVAAVIGIGSSREGFRAMVRHQMVRRILLVWILTPLLALFVSWGLEAWLR